jgi:ATP-dependent DNA helicase RecG
MIIENAERLGLAQLHQLRGRVGRGAAASHCVLLYQAPLSRTGRARLEALRDSDDGFYLAEKDLALRGPGEVLGTRQTGTLDLRVADLLRDQDQLPEIQARARALLASDPAAAERILRRWLGTRQQFMNA